MSNEFYDPPELLAPGIKARSADINQINQRLAAAFDKMPAELPVKGGFINFGANTGNQDNSYVVALASKIVAYTDGLEVKLRPLRDNTGACSINVNGIGNAPIKRADGSNPQAGDLQSNATIYLSYSSALSAFVLPPVVNSQLVIATAAAAAALASRNEAQLWATSLAIVSGDLYGARKYALDAANAANAAANWATSITLVDGTYYGARAYALSAGASAATAQAWASQLNSAVAGGEMSAKYWAQQAAATAAQSSVGQVQADWAQSSTASKAYIWNKPDIAAMIAATAPNKISGGYTSGGPEKPSAFGGNVLRLQMLAGSNIAGGAIWNDALWMSSYGGPDVKGSNALIMGKTGDFMGFARQDYDSGAWGALRTVWHSGNMPAPSVGPAGNTLVQRGADGYIDGTYIHMTDQSGTGGTGTDGAVSAIIAKHGDNYYRSTNAAAVRTFLGYTGNLIVTDRTNAATDITVAKELRWDKFGNSHTIVDFSNKPNTADPINCNNSRYGWAPGYPLLVAWNGSDSYGVRVDSARVADSTASAAKADFLNQPGDALIDMSTPPATFARGLSTSFADTARGWFSYGGLIQFRPASGSVGGSLQMYVPYSPGSGGNTLRVRFGNYDTNAWTGWKDLITSENIGGYTAGSAGYATTAGSATNASNLNGLQTQQTDNTGKVWPYIPHVASGGVLEIGRYIDFHSASGDTGNDYGMRLDWNGSQLLANGYELVRNTGTASNLTVKDAGTLAGYAPQMTAVASTVVVRDGSGQMIATRVQAAAFTSNTGDNFTWNTYTVHHYGVTIAGNAFTVLSGFNGVAICTGGLERLGVAANGNVNVNQSLFVSGDITAFSDERLKTNWRPVAEDYVTRLAQVQCGVFDRVDTGQTQAGVSAQSFKKLLPEVVPIDANGIHSVNYGAGAMVNSIELAKEVVALRLQVAALMKRFESLEK